MPECNCVAFKSAAEGSNLIPNCRRNHVSLKRKSFISKVSSEVRSMEVISVFLFTLFACVSVTMGDVIPSYPNLPHKSGSMQLDRVSEGTQPEVQNLLASEPNCSRWIWGSCYYNFGACGEGKQHATRSGDGCRIIGITSRCFKACVQENNDLSTYDWYRPAPSSRCIWGVDCDNKEEKTPPKPQPDSWSNKNFENENDGMQVEPVPPSNNFYPPSPGGGSPNNMLLDESSDEEPGSHCRWEKASWTKCSNGMKYRTRKLRVNRGASRNLICPNMIRDSKACGSSMSKSGKTKKIARGSLSQNSGMVKDDVKIQYYPESMMPERPIDTGEQYKRSDTCQWDSSVMKCDKCDDKIQEMTCRMPLLSGNPKTCGEERKMQKSCDKD